MILESHDYIDFRRGGGDSSQLSEGDPCISRDRRATLSMLH